MNGISLKSAGNRQKILFSEGSIKRHSDKNTTNKPINCRNLGWFVK
jgi:hypothetical protein